MQKKLQGQEMKTEKTSAQVVKTKTETAFKQSKFCKAFAIVKHPKSNKYTISMGDYVLTKKEFETILDAEKYIQIKPYELIINAAFAAANFIINQQNKNQNEKTNY